MKLFPNIGPLTRLLYVLMGLGLIAAAVWAPSLDRPWPVIVGALGAVVMLEGAAGL